MSKAPVSVIYVASPEFLPYLREELNTAHHEVIGNLVFAAEAIPNVCFAQDIWWHPTIVQIRSISEAVSILKRNGIFWYLHPVSHIRRSRLIEAQLRKHPPLSQNFPISQPLPKIGAFSLLDEHTLVYSHHRWKSWPDGICQFIEDKVNPPNRAYLKLWEILSLLENYPKPHDTVLDLGASPGGWTYVMQTFGTQVTAVDKAPLATSVAQLPSVHCLQQSAFALDPLLLKAPYDWVLSDIACYPDRAYRLIKQWIDSGKAKRLIVTIKLQGEIQPNTLRSFQQIPNSDLFHLYHNKHEVTFIYPAPSRHLVPQTAP